MSRSCRAAGYPFAHLAGAGVLLVTAACGGGTPSTTAPPSAMRHQAISQYIEHVGVVIQENRSFDDLFATFPGADGATQGLMKTESGGDTYVPLKKVNLGTQCDPAHGYSGFLKNLDGGKMDGFALTGNKCGGNHTQPYQYVDPGQIGPYWAIASQYVLGDQMFQTQGSGSFTAHQDLIAGATAIDSKDSIIDTPSGSPWGCDAPKGTRTSLITTSKQILRGKGPFPCWNYPTGTMRDVLDAKGITWRYYVPPLKANTPGGDWNAYDAIEAVRNGPEWSNNISIP